MSIVLGNYITLDSMSKWNNATTRWTTEESKDICIKQFTGGEVAEGTMTWRMRGEVTGKAAFRSINARGVHRVNIAYFCNGDIAKQTINITSTQCQFGGERYWLQCPCCHKNSYRLYRPGDAPQFACRDCYNLTYQSCNENRRGRFIALKDSWRQEEKIRKLEKKMKRLYYAGEPTKSFQRILDSSY